MKKIIVLLVLVMSLSAIADYEISWRTIDGGGGTSSGGQYTLSGTIGQPDADFSGGGSYEVLGGFWTGGPLCMVNFIDFSMFAEWWLMPCNPGNNQCDGANLDGLGDVDTADLIILSEYWLDYCPTSWLLR